MSQNDRGQMADQDRSGATRRGAIRWLGRVLGSPLVLLIGVAFISNGGMESLAAGGAPPDASAAGPGWFDLGRASILIGAALLLLGAAGGGAAIVVEQRRRLRKAQDAFEARIAALQDQRLELETELSRQRERTKDLRDSEQRFRAFLQQLPAGVFLTDAQGEIRYVNDRWRLLAGLTTEQAAGSGVDSGSASG